MIYLDVSVVSFMSPKSIAVARIVGIMKKLRRWLLESENEAEMSSSQVGQSRAHTHARMLNLWLPQEHCCTHPNHLSILWR